MKWVDALTRRGRRCSALRRVVVWTSLVSSPRLLYSWLTGVFWQPRILPHPCDVDPECYILHPPTIPLTFIITTAIHPHLPFPFTIFFHFPCHGPVGSPPGGCWCVGWPPCGGRRVERCVWRDGGSGA